MLDTILIVDDEDSVRLTFTEWLTASLPTARVLAAADPAAALRLAREHPVDLALLDWNLGTGQNGLQLLEDLQAFRPDLVAILVTGYANQATPLDALRMGIRDYFDKSLDLGRQTLVEAVEKQLRLLRPLRREREMQAQLAAFRAALEESLALIHTGATLPGPEPFKDAVMVLLRQAKELLNATAAHLVWRTASSEGSPQETRLRYMDDGQVLEETRPDFPATLAGAAALQSCSASTVDLRQAEQEWKIELAPATRVYRQALLLPLSISPRVTGVLKVFDAKNGSFTAADELVLNRLAPVLRLLLMLAFTQAETRKLLLEAIESAVRLGAKEGQAGGIPSSVERSLSTSFLGDLEAPEAVALTRVLKELSARHGPQAMRRVLAIVEELRKLLDEQQGQEVSA